MPNHTFNSIWKLQNSKLQPATSKRGIISAVNVGAKTADVCFTQNPQTVVRSIPISGSINPATLTAGMQVGVDTYNETSPNSMVITYAIGQTPPVPPVPSIPLVGVPTSASSAGQVGQIACSSTYFYICYAENTWRRVSVSSF